MGESEREAVKARKEEGLWTGRKNHGEGRSVGEGESEEDQE